MIDIRNVTKSFGGSKILDALSIQLSTGRSLAIIGPAGAGKSVLLKCLAGIYECEEGQIYIHKQCVGLSKHRPRELNQRIGVLFQKNALFDSLLVWENIAFQFITEGVSQSSARKKAEKLLHAVGLSADVAHLLPSELSGGMQKRIAFARAIAYDPDILLLDDPLAGLDPILASRIQKMMMELTRERHITLIAVTGNIDNIYETYDEIAVLHDGIIRWHGQSEQAKTDSCPWLRQILEGRREGPIKSLVQHLV